MAKEQIRFDDGAAYERMMGTWSRLVGERFLAWLQPAPGLAWADIGCGNGAFTELLAQRTAPARIEGIDPSPAQLDFARKRGIGTAAFREGDAMALPFADASFDAAVMALVLFFVPDPETGFSEMVRVTRPGGLVAAYVWDIPGGGLPVEPINIELRAMGVEPLMPPSVPIARLEALEALWRSRALSGVETSTIEVERDFADFDMFWSVSAGASPLAQTLARMDASQAATLKQRVRERVSGAEGPLRLTARANAVQGRVPG